MARKAGGMMTTLSDNPGPLGGAVIAFVAALIAALNGFGLTHITAEQVTLVITLIGALAGLVAVILRYVTVPKTPSGSGTGTLQTPPPGTTLVLTQAAAASAPVPASAIVAGPTPQPPAP